jgi:hypothetical protein
LAARVQVTHESLKELICTAKLNLGTGTSAEIPIWLEWCEGARRATARPAEPLARRGSRFG